MKNFKKYLDDKSEITVSSREFFSDSENYPNEKAFYHFVNTLTADDKLYLYCINIDLSEINKKGKKYGDDKLKQIFNQISTITPIFRIQGTKFNIIVNESLKELDKKLGKFNSTFIYGKVIKEEYLSKFNVYELQRKGIELMFKDREERNSKSDNVTDNIKIESNENKNVEIKSNQLQKFILPFEEEFKENELYKKEEPLFKSDDALWYATITIHETKPKVKDVKAYVFPIEYKPNMELAECIVVYDDFIMSRTYKGKNPIVPIDSMKLYFSAKFNSNNQLNVTIIQDSESLTNDTGEFDYEIDIHEGKYIPEIFGKRLGKKILYPVKKNSKGLEEYVIYNSESKELIYNSDGIYEGKNLYEVHRDFTGIRFVQVKNQK